MPKAYRRESTVKAAVRKRLEYYGLRSVTKAPDHPNPIEGFFFMPHAGPGSVHGIHDFVGCWRGIFFSLETKAPSNPHDATEPQRAFQAAVTKAGGLSYVGVRDASVVDELARRIKEMT